MLTEDNTFQNNTFNEASQAMGFSSEASDPPPKKTASNTDNSDWRAGVDKLVRDNTLQNTSTVKQYSKDVVEPYSSQKHFQAEGFNPLDMQGNRQRYEAHDTWGEVMNKSLDDFGYKFTNSFVEGFYSTGRVLRSLATMGHYGFNKDEDDLLAQYYKDQENELQNAIFQSAEEEDKFFNKQFLKDFVGNSGYSLGTIASVITEAVLTWGVGSMASLGMKGVGAIGKIGQTTIKTIEAEKIAEAAAKTAQGIAGAEGALNTIGKAEQLSKLGTSGKKVGGRLLKHVTDLFSGTWADVAKAESMYRKIYFGAENVLPVVGTLMQGTRQLNAAARVGASGAQLGKIGFNTFRRGMMEMTLATSESAFESASAYGEQYVGLNREFKELHGRNPSQEENSRIREAAMNTGAATFDINMGVLMTMNKIQFGNLFSKVIPTNKLVGGMLKARSSSAVVDTVEDGAKKQMFKRGFFGTVGNAGKIAKEFGKKKAAWEVTKATGRGFSKFEMTEGVQELLQEGSAVGVRNYYKSLYDRNPIGFSDAFEDSVDSQNNRQGFKTFLIGAFTGRLIAPIIHVQQHAAEYISDRATGNTEARAAQEKSFDKDIATLNQLFKNPKLAFDENIANFKKQISTSERLTTAAFDPDGKAHSLNVINDYEFHNASEDSLVAAVQAAVRTNTVDALVSTMRKAGESFDTAAFAQAFNIDITETKYNSVSEFTGKIAKQIENYAETFENLSHKYGATIDPNVFKKDSADYTRSLFVQKALNEAIDIIAINSIKGGMQAERAKKVLADISSIPEFANSAEFATRVLSDKYTLLSEIGLLQAEIQNMKVSYNGLQISKEEAESLKNKEVELALLREWDKMWLEENTVAEQMAANEKLEESQRKPIAKARIEFFGTTDKATFLNENTTPEQRVKLLNEGLKNDKVKGLMQKIINIKNKQAGSNVEVSNMTMTESMDKLVDYIRLNQNTRSYLKAVDLLTDRENFKNAALRLSDGMFKANVGATLQYLEQGLVARISLANIEKKYNVDLKGNDFEILRKLHEIEAEHPGINREVKKENDAVLQFMLGLDSHKQLQALYLSESSGAEAYVHLENLYKRAIYATKIEYGHMDAKDTENFEKEGFKMDEFTTKKPVPVNQDDEKEVVEEEETQVVKEESEISEDNLPALNQNDTIIEEEIIEDEEAVETVEETSEEIIESIDDTPAFETEWEIPKVTIEDNEDGKTSKVLSPDGEVISDTLTSEKALASATEQNNILLLQEVAENKFGKFLTIDMLGSFTEKVLGAFKVSNAGRKKRNKNAVLITLEEYLLTGGGLKIVAKTVTDMKSEQSEIQEAEFSEEELGDVTLSGELINDADRFGKVGNSITEGFDAIKAEALAKKLDKLFNPKEVIQNDDKVLQNQKENTNFVVKDTSDLMDANSKTEIISLLEAASLCTKTK